MAAVAKTEWKPAANPYPASRKSDHVNVYKSEKHGEVRVPDPFNWLEQNTEETDAWTTAQADFTRAFLDKNPHRVSLENELRANFDFEKVSRVALFIKFILITYMKIVVWDSFHADNHRPSENSSPAPC